MKIVEINSGNIGSTGNIMLGIAAIARTDGHEVLVCCPDARDNRKKLVNGQLFIGERLSRNLHLKCAEFTGLNGCFSQLATKKFLRAIDKYKPDVIHFHNLHNCYINLPMLFGYIKKRSIPTVWTLHDCWAITGQCTHFTMVKCDRWKTGCYDCPQYRQYPASYVDRTKTMWKFKKNWFTGVQNMTIVTPSQWLADLVKKSYLAEYPVKVINNGVDLGVFKPTESDFREKYGLQNKKILLGVAFGWGKSKGLDVFVELAKRLDEQYQIILVGTDNEVDKMLPNNIISIHRTRNQRELVALYSMADIFVNPTREEVLGMVNVEALACATPVITFRSGGSPECIDEKCGVVVECDDVDAMELEIKRLCWENAYGKELCVERARAFSDAIKYGEYVSLYESTLLSR